MSRTGLYRIFDESGSLIYIGIGSDPIGRVRDHRTMQAWGTEINRYEVEWHDSRRKAMRFELAAIRAERPKYNIAGVANKDAIVRPWSASGLVPTQEEYILETKRIAQAVSQLEDIRRKYERARRKAAKLHLAAMSAAADRDEMIHALARKYDSPAWGDIGAKTGLPAMTVKSIAMRHEGRIREGITGKRKPIRSLIAKLEDPT